MTLRTGLILVGGAGLIVGILALSLFDFPPAVVFGGWGVLILIGILCDRSRYKSLATNAPGAGWERKDERFIDDETGRPVRVYVQPNSGERRYVQE